MRIVNGNCRLKLCLCEIKICQLLQIKISVGDGMYEVYFYSLYLCTYVYGETEPENTATVDSSILCININRFEFEFLFHEFIFPLNICVL